MSHDKSYRGWAWLLLLMEAAARSGLALLSIPQLHRLIFLANSTSPIYDELPLRSYLLKFKDTGPFFPDAQWDIDLLVARKLLRPHNISYKRDANHQYWIDADYSITDTGRAIVEAVTRLPSQAQIFGLMRELTRGYARLLDSMASDHDAELLALFDVNYAAGLEDNLIEFGQINLGADVADLIFNNIPKGVSLDRRGKLYLYIGYLTRILQKAQVAA